MTIEDIIRKVIREELSVLDLVQKTSAHIVHEAQPEPEEMSDFFEEPEPPEITNTLELLEYLKANCTPVQAKRAKDVVVNLGYERVSIVPNDKVQEVLAAILLEVFN